jgi:hypothetical protein
MLAEATAGKPIQAPESRCGPSHAEICRPPSHLPVGVLDDLCDGNQVPAAIDHLPKVFPFSRFRLLRWHHIQEFEATSEAVLLKLEGQPEKIQGVLTSSMNRH